jgi:hypothetical protein
VDFLPGFAEALYYSGVASLRMGELDRAYDEIKSAGEKGFKEVSPELISQIEKTLHIYA